MEENCPVVSSSGGSDYIQGEAVRNGKARGELVMPSQRARVMDKHGQAGAAVIADNEPENVGYQPTCHGITASPKVQEMLKEHRHYIDIYDAK